MTSGDHLDAEQAQYLYFHQSTSRLKEKARLLKASLAAQQTQVNLLYGKVNAVKFKLSLAVKTGMLQQAEKYSNAVADLNARIYRLEGSLRLQRMAYLAVNWSLLMRDAVSFRNYVMKCHSSTDKIKGKLTKLKDLQRSIDVSLASTPIEEEFSETETSSKVGLSSFLPPKMLIRVLQSELKELDQLARTTLRNTLEEFEALSRLIMIFDSLSEHEKQSTLLSVSADDLKSAQRALQRDCREIQLIIHELPTLIAHSSLSASNLYSGVMDRATAIVNERERKAKNFKTVFAEIDKQTIRRLERKVEEVSKSASKLESTQTTFLNSTQQDSNSIDNKQWRMLKESLVRLTELTDELRRDINLTVKNEKIRQLPCASSAEQVLQNSCGLCLRAHQVIRHALAQLVSQALDKLKNMQFENLSLAANDAERKYEQSLVVELLSLTENSLAHEIGLKQDLNRLRTAQKSLRSSLISESPTEPTEDETNKLSRFIESDQELLNGYAEETSSYKSLKSQLLEAMKRVGLVDSNTSYDKYLIKSTNDFAIEVQSDPRKDLNPAKFVSTIQAPLERVVELLAYLDQSFDEVAFSGEAQKTLAATATDLAGTLNQQNLKEDNPVRLRLRNEIDRSKVRIALADMVNAERELRNLTLCALTEEKEKAELWQRRILVARKVANNELAEAAEQRKKLHDEVIEVLTTLIQCSGLDAIELPESFVHAQKMLERVEAKLGLKPNPSLQSDLVVALSLFDRVVLLVETMNLFMDAELSQKEKTLRTT